MIASIFCFVWLKWLFARYAFILMIFCFISFRYREMISIDWWFVYNSISHTLRLSSIMQFRADSIIERAYWSDARSLISLRRRGVIWQAWGFPLIDALSDASRHIYYMAFARRRAHMIFWDAPKSRGFSHTPADEGQEWLFRMLLASRYVDNFQQCKMGNMAIAAVIKIWLLFIFFWHLKHYHYTWFIIELRRLYALISLPMPFRQQLLILFRFRGIFAAWCSLSFAMYDIWLTINILISLRDAIVLKHFDNSCYFLTPENASTICDTHWYSNKI